MYLFVKSFASEPLPSRRYVIKKIHSETMQVVEYYESTSNTMKVYTWAHTRNYRLNQGRDRLSRTKLYSTMHEKERTLRDPMFTVHQSSQ